MPDATLIKQYFFRYCAYQQMNNSVRQMCLAVAAILPRKANAQEAINRRK